METPHLLILSLPNNHNTVSVKRISPSVNTSCHGNISYWSVTVQWLLPCVIQDRINSLAPGKFKWNWHQAITWINDDLKVETDDHMNAQNDILDEKCNWFHSSCMTNMIINSLRPDDAYNYSVNNRVIISSCNGLSPAWRQATAWSTMLTYRHCHHWE